MGTKLMTRKNKMVLAILSAIAILIIIFFSSLIFPIPADAAIYTGDTVIEGYEPKDIIDTDISVDTTDPGEAAGKLENLVVKAIKTLMPFLMIVCVGLIVFNAVRNLFYFNKKEKQVGMGELIKNIIVQFFFILFAFIIVELIVFVVTGGEALLFATLLS